MDIAKIITLSNSKTAIPLQAMVRSLRAVGCELPVHVIPYDDDRFELPPNCEWTENLPFKHWLELNTPSGHARAVMRKYQCLLDHSYQFVDSDVIFLRNPQEILRPMDGFITSCLHWNNPEHTFTPESRELLKKRSTLWCASVFNSGQFACDQALFTLESLAAEALDPKCCSTILGNRHHEQAGMNLLVHLSKVPVTNLTLPPFSMESTWAGDYESIPHPRWSIPECKPYLIHWAGTKPDGSRHVDELFFSFLTDSEQQKWISSQSKTAKSLQVKLRHKVRALVSAWRSS